MKKRTNTPAATLALAMLALSFAAGAASPQLTRILPRGGQRGTEVELTFHGARLADAQEVFIYEPGITVLKVGPSTEKGAVAGTQAKVLVKIAPDARLGQYQVRLRTATGISELRTFWVGAYPVIEERERPDPKTGYLGNSDFKNPQPIPMNVTVAGVIDNEDQDYFVVEAKKGQRITAEVEGMRLGEAIFDPYLAILDENRFELAANDDSALLKQDAVVQVIAPKDGKYIIQLRESAFGGASNAYYRLHVGNFPRPRVTYPLGGQAGQTINVQFLGDVAGPITQSIKLPDKADDNFELYCVQDGLTAPSANHFHVSEFPNVNEVAPNDTFKTATPYTGPLPVAFNGILSKPAGASASAADEKNQGSDYFKFAAKKGQSLDINVFARRLRSPLDPVLVLLDPQGRQITTNDDNGGPDSYLRFAVPADGDYGIRVRDHLRAAGDTYAYRVEITPIKPAISLIIPQYTAQYSQERQAVTVPKGNRYATLLRVQRQDAPGGPLALSFPGLPAGVKFEVENFEPGVDAVPVLFEAQPDAKVGGALVETHAKLLPAPDAKPDAKPAAPVEVATGFKQITELVTNGNNPPYYTSTVDKMAFAVADEAPFKLKIVEPKVPIVQGGQMNLKVVAERKKDFVGPITVRLLFKPPGIEAAGNLDIPANQNEVVYPLSAGDNAALKKWKLIMVGSADDNGTTWVSSPFATLEVAAPFLTAKVITNNVERAKNVTMAADLDVKTRWEGEAKCELIGLPGNSTTVAKEISADDKRIEFPVTTAVTTPAAVHNSLFLQVTIMQNGEPIVHNIGRGGVLRVDLPLGAKPEPTAAPTTKPTKTKTPKTKTTAAKADK